MAEAKNTRIDLRATPAWKRRAKEAADRKGLSLSSYIVMAVTDRMDADGVPAFVKDPKK